MFWPGRSLYDNNIKTIQEGTFSDLPAIQTLHLGRNPFVCDCSLQWLSEYLERNPIETSGARCNLPRTLKRRKLTALAGQTLKCTDETVAQYAGACVAAEECPRGCSCRGTTVDCTAGGLTALPDTLPPYTTDLLLSDNELGEAAATDAVRQLSRLRRLVMANNQLRFLPPDLFSGLTTLEELDLSDNQLTTLTGEEFRDLPQLTTLVVTNNRLSCVAPGAFSSLPSLQHVGLEGNPLVCNCHLGWLADWLRLHNQSPLPTSSPACHAPHHLRNKPITEIPRSAFSCRAGESSECLGSAGQQCPEQCSCEGTVVRCTRKRLTAIPPGLPAHTTELYLDVNQITEIDSDRLSHLKALTRLDLSNNQIAVLQNNTFSRLSQLSTLIVSFNKLQCMQRDALAGLTKLRILSLHGNDISRIPEGTFRNLEFITHIALGANPLYCDCELAWLSDWVKVDFVEPGIARCAEPAPMRDKLVLTTATEAFVCSVRVPNEVLAKCDLCYTQPCENGASCHSLANRSYECVCPPAYHGTNCQYKIDACYGNPCENQGTCKVVETGRFSCHCPPGFQGIRCEENIDDCSGHKCENGGQCVDLVQRYRCQCPPGYTGEYCEKKIDFCSKEFNPCKNGGSCVDHVTYYECQCPLGYSGDNCTIDINDCENNLCQNGATCIDGANEYTCKCVGDFSGKFCEVGPAVFQQTSPCQQNDCQNGICFVPPNSQDYVCKCSPGFSGKHCEYLTRVRFTLENSFIALDSLKTKPSSNVTLHFRTTEENGIILYVGDSAHLAVELFRGRLRVSYDVGNHPISNMFSYEIVSDGRWHRVELLTQKQNFTLKVDSGRSRSIVNDGSNEFLETESPLYLGGLPREIARNAVKMWHLRDTDSFMGCMDRVYIGGRLADLSAGKQHQVNPGCGGEEQVRDQGAYHLAQAAILAGGAAKGGSIHSGLMHSTGTNSTNSNAHSNKDTQMQVHPPARELSFSRVEEEATKTVTDPCQNHKCKRGRCKPKKKRPDQYKCRCRSGWAGKFCDKVPTSGPSCRKEQFTEYYVEHSCRSRKPIKNAICSGTCNQDCCKPRRTKLRKVRLICNDGTSYTKEIEVVRKCQCTRRCY
ncbi:Laminin G domain [Trinorchestia longiramus]|nr:Laminin G domain [Trinorchestia longiramus]